MLVSFKATGAGSGASYTWDFGSGNVSGTDSMQKIFTTPGKYTIKLTVVLSNGTPCSTITKTDLFEVLPSPTPLIKVTQGTVVCNGVRTLDFQDITPGSVSREWVIDGVTYTSSSVQHKFSSSGYKSVSLKVTNSYGCNGFFTDNKYIQLYDSAETDFCADIYKYTTYVKAKYKANITATGRTVAKYEWQFPGGVPSSDTGKIPKDVTYSNPNGNYDVTLKITMADGCTYTCARKSFIQPYVSFPNDTTCTKQYFTVVNNANNNGKGFFGWQFTGADIDPFNSTSTKTRLRYLNPGQYDMTFSFKYNSNGCNTIVYYYKYVTVLGPKADFSTLDRNGCSLPYKVKLNNLSDPYGASNVKYTWRILDSNKVEIKGSPMGPSSNYDTSFIFKQYGKFTVKLFATSTNGCTDSMIKDRYISNVKQKADFTVDKTTICLGEKFTFKDKTTPSEDISNPYNYTYNIQHQDSSVLFYTYSVKNPLFEPVAPGKYDVTMIVTTSKGCADTLVRTGFLTVNGVDAEIGIDNTLGCAPVNSKMVALIKHKYPNSPFNNLTYEWQVDPKDDADIWTPNAITTGITFKKKGCYTVTLLIYDAQKCTTTISKTGIACIGVSAGFNIDSNKCLGVQLNTYNTSGQSPDGYKWSITPSKYALILPNDTVAQPTITLSKDTTYDIKLIAYKKYFGTPCNDTFTKTYVQKLPHAIFTSSSSVVYCAPTIVQFTNQSTGAQKFFWDFGDGDTLWSNNVKIVHVYKTNNPNGYTVKLLAIDTISGCTGITEMTNFVKVVGPVPKFSIDKNFLCDSGDVTFTNLNSNVYSYLVDYDDGSPLDTQLSKVHHYKLNKSVDSFLFKPVILAKDNSTPKPCLSYFRDTIVVYRSASSALQADKTEGCAPLTVSFSTLSKIHKLLLWDLNGDGIYDDTSSNPSYTYSTKGNYTIKLRSLNYAGCEDSVTLVDYIKVTDHPNAIFTLPSKSICHKDEVTLINNSNNYTKFVIDYGDGTVPDTNKIIPHKFYWNGTGNNPSYYTIKGTAFSGVGCSDIWIDTIMVFPSPKPQFSVDINSGCTPLKVNFINQSYNSIKYYWYFDNDNLPDDSSFEPSHVFLEGKHTIKLVAISSKGCVDSLIIKDLVIVNPLPIVDFKVNDTFSCYNSPVTFSDNSSASNATIVSYKWVFDEPLIPDTSSLSNPTFSYRTSGWHYVKLTVTDSKGCSNTITKKAIYVDDTLKPITSEIRSVSVIDGKGIQIIWAKSALSDFSKYELVSQKTNSILRSTNNILDTILLDLKSTSELDSQSHCYQLRTMDRCKTYSLFSNTHCSVNLKVTPIGNTTLMLKWTPYIGWSAVKYYEIYRSSDSITFQPLTTVSNTTTEYSDTNLCDNKYFYFIKAYENLSSLTSLSNHVGIKPNYVYQLNPILLRYATVTSNNSIKVVWEKGIQTNIKRYLIDRQKNNLPWEINYASTNAPQFLDNLADVFNNNYSYKVRVEDDCGNVNSPSNLGSNILLSSKVINDKVYLSWNPYSYWKGGISKYVVEIRNSLHQFEALVELEPNQTSWIDDSIHSNVDTAYCYRVLAIENGGYKDSSYSNISCSVLPSRIFIPNAFTPNGDKLNDVWKFSTLSIFNHSQLPLQMFSLKIYNLWGQLVYITDDSNFQWDAKIGGKTVEEGTYIYTMDAMGIDRIPYHLKGNVSVIY